MSDPVDHDEPCDQCQHSSDDHALIAFGTARPITGGIRLCPVRDCQCFATWGVPVLGTHGPDDVQVPPEADVRILRERLQSGRL